MVQDPARATRVFDALKALDATVAMDDFGTGYSSLAYLQRLPIDVLKIDKSFVSGMMVDPDAVAIVRAVLSLAEALGMSTTAEGIETVELATTLATLGCASGQGFYFAKPLRPRRRSNIGNRAGAEIDAFDREVRSKRLAGVASSHSRKSCRCCSRFAAHDNPAGEPRFASPGLGRGAVPRPLAAISAVARGFGSPR